jgi:hypothetical protein
VGTFDEGFRVEGEPLGFYHFTGFDSGAHRLMANRYAPGNRSVGMLIEWYESHTRALAPGDAVAWSLATYDDGQPIAQSHRSIYRQRPDLKRAFPNPYETAGDSYRAWVHHHGAKEYPQLFER